MTGTAHPPPSKPTVHGGQKRLEEFREWFKAWLPEVRKEAAIV